MSKVNLDIQKVRKVLRKKNAPAYSSRSSDEKIFATQIIKTSSNYVAKKLINLIFK